MSPRDQADARTTRPVDPPDPAHNTDDAPDGTPDPTNGTDRTPDPATSATEAKNAAGALIGAGAAAVDSDNGDGDADAESIVVGGKPADAGDVLDGGEAPADGFGQVPDSATLAAEVTSAAGARNVAGALIGAGAAAVDSDNADGAADAESIVVSGKAADAAADAGDVLDGGQASADGFRQMPDSAIPAAGATSAAEARNADAVDNALVGGQASTGGFRQAPDPAALAAEPTSAAENADAAGNALVGGHDPSDGVGQASEPAIPAAEARNAAEAVDAFGSDSADNAGSALDGVPDPNDGFGQALARAAERRAAGHPATDDWLAADEPSSSEPPTRRGRAATARTTPDDWLAADERPPSEPPTRRGRATTARTNSDDWLTADGPVAEEPQQRRTPAARRGAVPNGARSGRRAAVDAPDSQAVSGDAEFRRASAWLADVQASAAARAEDRGSDEPNPDGWLAADGSVAEEPPQRRTPAVRRGAVPNGARSGRRAAADEPDSRAVSGDAPPPADGDAEFRRAGGRAVAGEPDGRAASGDARSSARDDAELRRASAWLADIQASASARVEDRPSDEPNPDGWPAADGSAAEKPRQRETTTARRGTPNSARSGDSRSAAEGAGRDAAPPAGDGGGAGESGRRARRARPRAEFGEPDSALDGEPSRGRSGRRKSRNAGAVSVPSSRRDDAKPRREKGQADVDPVAKAKDICFNLIAARARTRVELTQTLKRKGFDEQVIDQVLARLDEMRLIDDAAFADEWVHSRHTYQGLGRGALKAELRRKGVADDVAAEAISTVDRESEEQRARELVRKRLRTMSGLDDTVKLRRLLGMLARKGYSQGLAYGVIKDELRADVDFPE